MRQNQTLAGKVIVALDVNSGKDALSLVAQLPEAEIFKVGVRLFVSEGPALVEEVYRLGKRVFLDLKFHDIPSTVAGAVRAGTIPGVSMMTLHASGGGEMMAAAAHAASEESARKGLPRPLLLAVTVLTSLKKEQLEELGTDTSVERQVLRLARLAQKEGVDGVVCSPLETELIKKNCGKDFIVVTPGIRPSWAGAQDQKRILTPLEALKKGGDYMVIGRPIIAAASPAEAFSRILEELRRGVHTADGKNRP
ncbi:MAG: orotidine-5'-phosphate decarboxylase [Candidatus Aminicenantales bacterium]